MTLKYYLGSTDADGRYYLTATAGDVLGSRYYNLRDGKILINNAVAPIRAKLDAIKGSL